LIAPTKHCLKATNDYISQRIMEASNNKDERMKNITEVIIESSSLSQTSIIESINHLNESTKSILQDNMRQTKQ
jgi:uncharacterized protein YfaQ (DUF2300 family)